ncbi:MAG: reverse transcriptase domain-containing protein [Xenococcaceae cyanobacterium MO_167.B52]|nr:reverse transcriptase domain-containing protein [Xenococcaceae cyanobacterium MO_167.B52]
MSQQPRTRQELYDLVRRRGKDEYVLEEMIRLGFWSPEGELPEDPADDIRRMSEIRRELNELRRESRNLQNQKLLRKRLLQERLAESRRKQQENKAKREQERVARAEAWQRKKQTEITYLGEDVSGGLNYQECNEARLQELGLPILGNALDIATAMDITVPELRFLAFNRKTSTVSHYIRFKIPKKTGGERLISAPMPRLKRSQYWILEHILNKMPVHDAVHGFRCDRSILTNAKPHVGANMVINFDLQDFFPSISYRRVKGLFRSFGYSEAAATILGLLCTEAELEQVELDSKIYYVALGKRHLPQGSPASPAITNIMCRRLDQRLTRMAHQWQFVYTRYADDLTFSTISENPRICNILKNTDSIVQHEGFQINHQKTRVLRNSHQQEVTGIVVNEKLNIDRKTLKRFRATLHQIETKGINHVSWGHGEDTLASIQGFANFVNMVNPEKGAKFMAQIQQISNKLNPQ